MGAMVRGGRPYSNEKEFLAWVAGREGVKVSKTDLGVIVVYSVSTPGLATIFKFRNGEPYYD